MFEKLTELISTGDHKEALYEFQEEFLHIDERTPLEASRLCVLTATLWEQLEDSIAEFDTIAKGLSYDPTNYELYYMLGLYYLELNADQAYLCFKMALMYCTDDQDREVITQGIHTLLETRHVRVRRTSVMILSYNDLEILRDCIQSVEESFPKDELEIVVVDNASSQEGLIEYLREKKSTADYPFRLIENSENLGFSKGCNIGAAACDPDNDIFFLNNDAVLMPGSFFYLKMGLYENRNVGAVGALSNSASLQELPASFFGQEDSEDGLMWHKRLGYKKALEVFRDCARTKVVPMLRPYIASFRLTGFALLVSRTALLAVTKDGQVFDEYFSPAYFEDDDLCMRIARAGFLQYLCKNSLIYHNGGGSFMGDNTLMEKGRDKFKEKWGFDVWGYSLPWFEAADKVIQIAREKKGQIRILDFTCGFGVTGAYIKDQVPTAFVAGMCRTGFEAGIAKNLVDDVAFGEMNTIRLPWEGHSFDVVLAETSMVSRGRISECLKEGGIGITQEDFE
jgi:GT2 family glycosyltransferase